MPDPNAHKKGRRPLQFFKGDQFGLRAFVRRVAGTNSIGNRKQLHYKPITDMKSMLLILGAGIAGLDRVFDAGL
ncbi:MAG: hypothetical protein AAF711_11140 [Planctomycetota bacterium]